MASIGPSIGHQLNRDYPSRTFFFLPFHHGPQTYIPHSRGQTCCRSREKQEVLQQVCISSNCSKGTLTVTHKSTRAKDKINAKRRIQYRKKIEEFQKVFAVFII